MAYVEVDALVVPVHLGRTGIAGTRVVDYQDSLHIKVYDMPFTGGDNDILLLERLTRFPWLL